MIYLLKFAGPVVKLILIAGVLQLAGVDVVGMLGQFVTDLGTMLLDEISVTISDLFGTWW